MTEPLGVGIIGAGAAIAGGIFSGFYQFVREWFIRPKLKIEFDQEGPGHVVDGAWKVGSNPHETGFRLVRPGLKNHGRSPAKNCRVFAVALHDVHGAKLEDVTFYDSMPLPWSGWTFEPRTLPAAKGLVYYFDLVRFQKDAVGWDFTFDRALFNHRKLRPRLGTYRFHIVATADNARPVYRDIDVEYNGNWEELKAWKVERG